MAKEKNVTVQSPTAAQHKEFWGQIDKGLITKKNFQEFLERKKGSQSHYNIYKKMYKNWDIALDVEPFENREGYWPVVVFKGLRNLQTFWRVNQVTNFLDIENSMLSRDDRYPSESYVVWVKSDVKIDPNFCNKSTSFLRKEGVLGVTLLEQIILEGFYFLLSEGNYLAVTQPTLCIGSHHPSDGRIPYVIKMGNELGVYYYKKSDIPRGPGVRPIFSF